MESKIFIIAHKECELPEIEGYVPLAVGSVGKEFPDNYLRDDKGDNISGKNDSYCELTGLYWLWKNCSKDYIGLVHYRRYFVKIKKTVKFMGRYLFFSKKHKYSILDIDGFEDLLDGFDIIVKESNERKIDNGTLFSKLLGDEIWQALCARISQEENKYRASFDSLCKKYKHINCNMFYGRKEIIDEYSKWVFPILESIDDMHVKKHKERYHKRELGYVAELLFGVWIEAECLSYRCVPVANTGDSYAMDGVLNFPQLIRFLIIKPLNHLLGWHLR
ncbi:DUF4422 domain-containing protein [uncultured Acetatifactor sp.]|jgi:hypothetical protein|uniref:DUF4422 domain-containing protein n=1 Tax=uncultured Acetatifactor sp. TaxID=1671927 RepID=UPI002614F14C|nr:DUF4422 domain-containing protein [uncultured Acetatifactor sp.]